MSVNEIEGKLQINSKTHNRVLKALDARFQLSRNKMTSLHTAWRKSEDQFLAYLPESEADASRREKRENSGSPQYTTVVLPYTYAILMSAHSYWSTVFLTRDPVFQFTGRHGEGEQQTQAIEALMGYQMSVGEMLLPLYIWLLDAGKYGLGIIGNFWEQEITQVTAWQAVPQTLAGLTIGEPEMQKVVQQIPGYQGNKVFNIRPYDYFPDPRVPLYQPQKGEFVGYMSELSWNDIVRRVKSGSYIAQNAMALKEKLKPGSTTLRVQGSSQQELPASEFSGGYNSDLLDTGPYSILTIYVDLIASEWGLGDSDYPEKWVFTCGMSGSSTTGGASLEVILEARPLGAYHNSFPINVLEVEPEGYAFAARGIPDILAPIQNALDWLLNSHMYSVRKTMNNQFVIDPSRIIMSDFSNPLHGGAIRSKPAAYGQDVSGAIKQLGVVDVTQGHMADMARFSEFGQLAAGVNEQVMGQLNVGGRKTAQEIRTSSTFGVNRLKTIAEYMSAMGFTPLASMLVKSSQQYYTAPLKLKIVGDLVQQLSNADRFINVTPELIAGSFDFVPVDGTMPIDRFAQANLWQQILATAVRFPQVLQQYDIGRIFGWVAQLAGLKNINQFKLVLGTPESIMQSAQAGNLVPMPKQRPATQVPEPNQIPQMGRTG